MNNNDMNLRIDQLERMISHLRFCNDAINDDLDPNAIDYTPESLELTLDALIDDAHECPDDSNIHPLNERDMIAFAELLKNMTIIDQI